MQERLDLGARMGWQDDVSPLDPEELADDERLLLGQGRSLAELALRRQAAAHTQRVADLVACAVAGMQSGLDVRSECERLAAEPDPVLGEPVGCDGLLDVLSPLLIGMWGGLRLSPDAFADAVITDAATARLAGGSGPLVDCDAGTVLRASELAAALVRFAAALADRFGFSPAEAAALGLSDDDPRVLLLAAEFAAQCAPAGPASAAVSTPLQAWADDRDEDLVEVLVAGVLLACWASSGREAPTC
jgi:hypothetical protein